MNRKSLPFLPLNFFYFPFSQIQKRVFWVICLGSMLSGAVFLVHFLWPEIYIDPIQAVGTVEQQAVEIDTLQAQYRSLPLHLNAFRQWISYSAGPIQPNDTPLWFFAILLSFGWTGLLTALSKTQSRWVWAGYAAYALFIHFGEVASLAFPGDTYHLLEFIYIILPLGLTFAFQSEWIKAGLGVRFVILGGLISGILASIAFAESPGLAYHQLLSNSFTFFAILSVGFLFFIGKEPTNLLIVLATNRRQPEKRFDFRIVFSLLLILLLFEFVWVNEYMDFNLLGGYTLNLRPSMFIAIAGIFTAFTSQNSFYQVKSILGSNFTFSLILLSWTTLIFAFLGVNYAQGNAIFVYSIERMAVLAFFGLGAAHTFFIIVNHKDLLAQRINLYYILMQGRRFGFAVVWLIGLCVLVFAEGSDGWKTIELFYHDRACLEGDIAWQKNDLERAEFAYKIAAAASPVSPKANYNLAAIKLNNTEGIAEALQHYQRADDEFPMPRATLNAAHILHLNNQTGQAIRILRTGMEKGQDGRLANNLGLLYLDQQEIDSAIVSFKNAIKQTPDLAAPFSNLGLLYLDFDRPQWADSMMQFAGKSKVIPDPVQANQYFLALKQETEQAALSEKESADPLTQYNQTLYALREGSLPANKQTLKQLADETRLPDAILLDGHLLFAADSISYAISRLQFLAEAYPGHSADAYRVLALNYFERQVPEMARIYFQKAGAAGDSAALLSAALMLIDMGQAEAASLELGTLRAEKPQFWEAAAKELAMLLTAYGQGLYAATEWDVSSLSFEEKMRISRYADSIQFFVPALENYRQILASDSSTILPYLEMGRLYLKYRDTLALTNLEFGLQKAANHAGLQIAYSEALLQTAQQDAADSLFAIIAPGPQDSVAYLKVKASQELMQGDSVRSIETLAKLRAQAPLNAEILMQWAELIVAQGQLAEAHAALSEMIEYNDQHAGLWLLYTEFSLAYGLAEDAAYGLEQAIVLTEDPAVQASYRAQFEKWEAQLGVN